MAGVELSGLQSPSVNLDVDRTVCRRQAARWHCHWYNGVIRGKEACLYKRVASASRA